MIDGNNFISCSIVVEQYHDFGQQFIDRIERAFGQELLIEGTGGIRSFLAYPTDSDLLITTTDMPIAHAHKVLVSPLLGMRDMRIIRDEIDCIKAEKLAHHAKEFLLRLIKPGCFVRNADFDGPETCIRYLGGLARQQELIDTPFIEDVVLRERVSSTSFVDGLAIPPTASASSLMLHSSASCTMTHRFPGQEQREHSPSHGPGPAGHEAVPSHIRLSGGPVLLDLCYVEYPQV